MTEIPVRRAALRVLVAVTALITTATPITMRAASASASEPAPSGDFAALTATAKQEGSVRVIVELDDAPTPGAIRQQQARVSADVAGSATVETKLTTIPAMVVDASPAAIKKLQQSDEVKSVTVDHANSLTLDVSTGVIQASTLWTQGVTGLGTNVAVIDTGVDTTHPMLTGKVVAEACFTVNACPNGTSNMVGTGAAKPVHPHGTHVASTAAGRAWTAPNGMKLRGVAPDAGVFAVQVFQNVNGTVLAYDSSMLNAIDWVVQQRATKPIAALNLSIGGGLYKSQLECDTARPGFAPAFQKARAAGIAPVVSAGNNGATGAMSGPGCATGAVSVAAVGNDTRNQIPAYSNIATWTSVFAPGGCGPATGRAVYAGIPGAQVAGYCGTSMAAPHVSGAFALLRQKQLTLTVDTLVKNLQTTGATVTSARNPGGVKAIRVANALAAPTATATPVAVSSTTTTTTQPTPTTTTTPKTAAPKAPTPTTTPAPRATPKPAPKPMPKPKRVIRVAAPQSVTPTSTTPLPPAPPAPKPTPSRATPQPVSAPVALPRTTPPAPTRAPAPSPTARSTVLHIPISAIEDSLRPASAH